MIPSKWKSIVTLCLMTSAATAFASCGSDGNTGDGCSGSLQCVDPVTHYSCSDQYCFYPPAGVMSQTDCCRRFGDIGSLSEESFEINEY